MHAVFFSLSFGLTLISSAAGHATAWHPSMWGFNFTGGGNRPQDPLMQRSFKDWWFHGHLDYPPHQDDWLEFPAGGKTTVEITCDKGASSYYTSNPGGDIRQGNDVCPGQSPIEYHTNGPDDLKGCAFAIAYIPPSEVNSIKPEDFTIFTVNQTCVWNRFTDFHVPSKMPPCPAGGCTCAWFWIHSADQGSEQIYMNGYQCKITGAASGVQLAKPQVARRCGEDIEFDRNKPASAGNCTYGAKQPLYWLQLEGNNEFEDNWHPPYYNDLYHYLDGAQEDIFVDSELPTMTWAGAPTGQLKPVGGDFGGAAQTATPTAAKHHQTEVPVAPAATPTASPGDDSDDDDSNENGYSPPSPSPDHASVSDSSESSDESGYGSDDSSSSDTNTNNDAPPTNYSPSTESNHGNGSEDEGESKQKSKSKHPKDCKCHKCTGRKKHPQSASENITETHRTISPEEANSIVNAAKTMSGATVSTPTPPVAANVGADPEPTSVHDKGKDTEDTDCSSHSSYSSQYKRNIRRTGPVKYHYGRHMHSRIRTH